MLEVNFLPGSLICALWVGTGKHLRNAPICVQRSDYWFPHCDRVVVTTPKNLLSALKWH